VPPAADEANTAGDRIGERRQVIDLVEVGGEQYRVRYESS
jgi:hypothetical protein